MISPATAQRLAARVGSDGHVPATGDTVPLVSDVGGVSEVIYLRGGHVHHDRAARIISPDHEPEAFRSFVLGAPRVPWSELAGTEAGTIIAGALRRFAAKQLRATVNRWLRVDALVGVA